MMTTRRRRTRTQRELPPPALASVSALPTHDASRASAPPRPHSGCCKGHCAPLAPEQRRVVRTRHRPIATSRAVARSNLWRRRPASGFQRRGVGLGVRGS